MSSKSFAASWLLLVAAMVASAVGCRSSNEWGDGDGDSDADVDVDVDADVDADSDADPPDGSLPWVEIVAPRGGVVENPVTFEFEAGGGVVTVAFEADGWQLQDAPIAADVGSHTYTFTTTDIERRVLLFGHDEVGDEVAYDEVWLTPVDPPPDEVFPISLDEEGLYLSNFDSSSCTGSFGSSRSGGRLHAGCDLYWTDDDGYAYVSAYHSLNDDLGVYAVADGVIIDYSGFYMGTNELVVDHGDFVIRYGEVDAWGLPGGLDVGSTVTAGQLIATMGDLDMSGSAWSMLHLELYSGELDGPLTDTSNWSYLHVADANYQRRGDLMDCTPFLLDLLDAAGR